MKLTRRPRPVLLAIALCCVALPAVAQGQPGAAAGEPATAEPGATDQADDAVAKGRDHFKRGVEFYHEGNFRAALIEFRRANEVAPNYRIQFNLGQTYFELQNYAGALRAFETYLKEGGKEVSASRQAEVEIELEKLRARVAHVTITTNVEGAEILVDDSVVGKSPLDGPILLSAGRRKLSVSSGRGMPTVKYVEIAGGDTLSVDLQLDTPADKTVPASAPPAAQATEAPTVDRGTDQGMGTGFWVSLVATGVFATGATISGIMASGAKSDYDSELENYPTTASDIQDAGDKTDRLALTTDILGGAAIAAGVLTVVFATTRSDAPASTAKVSEPQVRVGVGPGSFVLDGRF